MSNKRVGRHPEAFRRMAVERMKQCDHIGNLARELGVNRCQLYYWRRQAESSGARPQSTPPVSRQTALQRQNEQLKKALAVKVLEVDFFKGALQKIEARRQTKSGSGAPPSSRCSWSTSAATATAASHASCVDAAWPSTTNVSRG